MKIARFFIITFLLVGLLPAQGELKQESYWIYTYSSEIKDYQINAIEENELVINNGSWDVKLPITDIERIALSPGPSGLGQFLGKNLGACGGMCVGFLAGVIVFPQSLGVREEGINGLRAFIIAGALGGSYYGRKMGGNYLKADPKVLADMSMWTVDEKKEWIQTNLINY
ncbi:MAG: hypothetical protein QF795_04800 [Candidatus Marinimicrobia bacterium]|jgi:hypothetical protein|nr:hypothetical protein [Candidatus Neomarinimicrobiota bacterium]MDP7609155.1 hypothetical protein [Candidatus Neomarinimicrobiota bacterium]